MISVLLFNSETWLRLTKESIKRLESVDLMLLRKVLKTPISTPKVSLYLETGCVPLRYILKGKRIMFLHHILTRDINSLISRVFWAQVYDTGKGDWCQVVRQDLDMLGLENLSFSDIKSTSKESLKALINDRINITALEELLSEKSKLSKVSELTYTKLEMQQYLLDENLSTRQKQLLFRWRTKMTKVGWNYGKKDMLCPICSDAEDTQDHLLECSALSSDSLHNHSVDMEYDLNLHITRLEAVVRKREIILHEREKLKNVKT